MPNTFSTGEHWPRVSIAELERREEQRRLAQRAANQMAQGAIGHIDRVTTYIDDGVNMQPVLRNINPPTFNWQQLRWYDSGLRDEYVRDGGYAPATPVKPPLPKAQVTPQQMIEQVVSLSLEQAHASYVYRANAETRLGTDSSAVAEVAKKELAAVLTGRIANAVAGKTTTTYHHDAWGMRMHAQGEVVVMSVDDLHQMIVGIGQRVLEEAKKNGFIR